MGQRTCLGRPIGKWYIYWICSVASIANIFQGFDAGIYTIIVADDNFIDYFDATGARVGLIASMISLGNVIGNFFVAWWFIKWIGRRFAFVYGTCILLAGIALQTGAVHFAMMIIGRIIAGIGTSIIGTNLAAYQAEVAPAHIRGRVVSFVQLSYQAGVLIAYVVGLGMVRVTAWYSWRVSTALQAAPGFILIIAAFTIPESPRWMLSRHPDQPERALKELARIRQLPVDDEGLRQEHADLVAWQTVKMETEGSQDWRSILSSFPVWKRLAYGLCTMALGQISGIGALMIYGILIFQSLGFSSNLLAVLLNVVSGILGLLATAVTMTGVDKWGRRLTLLVGSGTMVLSYVIIASLAEAFPAETNFNSAASIVQVIFIYVIMMAYAGALGPAAWIYASEIFPTHLRDFGVNVSQAGQQTTTLWINQAWPVMFDTVGHSAYWIIASFNVLGFLLVLFLWPETKGISLEDMDEIFGEVNKVQTFREQNGVSYLEEKSLDADSTRQEVKRAEA